MRLPATLLALLVVFLAAIAPAGAAADLSKQVHQVLVLVSESIGTDADGMIRPQDADAMVTNTFNAIDANGDGQVTAAEFQEFSMGFEYLAQVRGKLPQFRAAKTAILQRWDARKAGFLTLQDYRAGVVGDLTRAANKAGTNDLKLSLDELKKAEFIRELAAAIE
jgi:hypothetical protein